MRASMADGHSASVAAQRVLLSAAGTALVRPLEGSPAGLAERLSAALDRFDEHAAHAVLDRLFASFSIETALADAVLPYLRSLGGRWESREVSIAQEHFATAIIRGRLLGLARDWGTGDGLLALLASPPGEHHDLGLIAFGLGLRQHGWRIALLGPNTPIDTVADAAAGLDPALILICGMEPSLMEAVRDDIGTLARHRRVAIAGPGATAALGRATRTWLVTGAPMAAATHVAAAFSHPEGPGSAPVVDPAR